MEEIINFLENKKNWYRANDYFEFDYTVDGNQIIMTISANNPFVSNTQTCGNTLTEVLEAEQRLENWKNNIALI